MAAGAAAAEAVPEAVVAESGEAPAGKDVTGDAAVTGASDENIVSVGSKDHGMLKEGQPACTPCAWFHKPSGCLNAKECYYCHLCPPEELKNRKKLKVQRMKSKELETKGDPSMTIKRTKTGPVGDSEETLDVKLRRANTMPSSTGDASPEDDDVDGTDGKRDGKLLLPGVGNAGQQPTVSEGSKLHGTLDSNGMPLCHPCAWFHKSSCKNDKDCIFCHLCPPGELKNRKKLKIAKLRDMDGATPSPASPSPNTLSGKRSDKRVQRAGTDPSSFVRSPAGMWPVTPFDTERSDKRMQRAGTGPASFIGSPTGMWPATPFDTGAVAATGFMPPAPPFDPSAAAAAGFMPPAPPFDPSAVAAAGYMPPAYGGMLDFHRPSPWPYMDPATFGYDPRIMIGMPQPNPSALPPDMSTMMSMTSAASMAEPMTVVANPPQEEPPMMVAANPLQDEPPGLSLPAEAPEGKITKINWSVDIRNLGSSKKASSPAFQVPGAKGNFRMALLPKGGASFADAAMRGTVQVVREEISPLLPGLVSMQVSVTGTGDPNVENQAAPRWPLKHDFALAHTFGLPEGVDTFDLEVIGGMSKAVNICLEILPPGMAT